MRAVIQRVHKAEVLAHGKIWGAIYEPGLLVLVGVTHADGDKQVEWMARKISEIRLLAGEKSVLDMSAPVLLVSQFTLYADVKKGRRPAWNNAASAEVAEPIFNKLVDRIRLLGITVQTGCFGADMTINMQADGPVTIILEQ